MVDLSGNSEKIYSSLNAMGPHQKRIWKQQMIYEKSICREGTG